jgi:hypothetical protein
MAQYRIYLLDANNRFRAVEVVECATDDEARAKAREVMGGLFAGAEVWTDGRLVAKIRGEQQV